MTRQTRKGLPDPAVNYLTHRTIIGITDI